MLAVTTDVAPVAPIPLPVKVVTAFPLPSVIADATDKVPKGITPVTAKLTVMPLTTVPVSVVTVAVTTLFEALVAKVVGIALTVMLKPDVAYGYVITLEALYGFPAIVMLAVTVSVSPVVPPAPVKMIVAFPFPSVIAVPGAATLPAPPPWVTVNVTVTSLIGVVPISTIAVTTLLEVAVVKTKGTASTVRL